jgi:hypothetical protein
VSLLLSSSATAQAPPVYFVGVQRGCDRDGRLDQAIERKLNKGGVSVQLLRQPSGDALPVCYGEACGKRLKTACPSAQGRVLGGAVVSERDTLQVRLWLHDLASGATAFQDDYCQSCDIMSAVTAQATRLLAAPSFGPAPGAQPAYCNASAAPAASRSPIGTLLLTVFGEGKHKAALQAAVKQQLTILGYKIEPQPIEAGKTTPDPKKLVAGHKNARVLGVEVPREGKLQLFLYDQRTDQTEGKLLDCPDCDTSKDTLVARVQPEVATLLDHCFGDACSQATAAIPTPPPQACTPFPDFTCGTSSERPTAPVMPARHIDATTAKLLLGSVWGLTTASAATALALAIANETSAGIVVSAGHEHYQTLTRPAWTAATLAIIGVGLAIPTTWFIRRAQRASQHATTSSSDSGLVCPNL